MVLIKHMAIMALLMLCSGLAFGEIYKSVDGSGHVTYSNVPTKGATKLNLDTGTPPPKKSQRSVSPSDFPRVDNETQKRRDETRRQVLNDELSAETKLLDQAKKELLAAEQTPQGNGAGQKALERMQNLKDNVTLHQKNIDALNKELGNLR